jgi:type I restriction enzyme R subunit
MDTPSFKEDHISQIPALQMLQKLGYKYLSPAETENLRGGKTSNVLLDDILRKQIKEINSDKRISSTKTTRLLTILKLIKENSNERRIHSR